MSLSNFGTNDLLVKDALTCRWIIESRYSHGDWWPWTFGEKLEYRTLDECIALLLHPFHQRYKENNYNTRMRNVITNEEIPAEIFG